MKAEVLETKSARVLRNTRETVTRRGQLAQEFRARLLEELGVTGDDATLSATREALISCAVSAHVEVVEISSRFLRGKASDKSLQRLGLARSELRRALRSLGVLSDPSLLGATLGGDK